MTNYQQHSDTAPTLRIAMLSIHSSPLGALGTRDTGGMSVYVSELAHQLGALGHAVDIFTYAAHQGQPSEIQLYPGVRLIHLRPANATVIAKEHLHTHLPRVFSALDTFRRCNDLDYDLIHSHYWISGVVGAMAQTRWQRPHLTMFHTLAKAKNNTASGENEPSLRIAHEHWLAKAVDAIIAPVSSEAHRLERLYHARPQKIHIIPCGVNLERFQPQKRKTARQQLGLDPDGQIVLYVGRFARLKGIDLLIKAAAQLKTQHPRLKLVIVGGDGPDSPAARDLKQLAHQLKIQHHIHFAGRIEQRDLPPYYSAADLLAVPSHYESFGLVALEALACGTPVVSTPVGVIKTVVQPKCNGLIVSSPNSQMLAQGLEAFLSQPHTRRPNTWQIRSTVTRYAWSNIAAKIVATYRDLIQAPGQYSHEKISNILP